MKMVKVYDYWMYLKIRNKKTEQYFEHYNYRRIAIYGMNYLGNRLYDELRGSSVEVILGIDREADGIEYDIPIYKIDDPKLMDKLFYVDAIIITVVASYQNILENLREIYKKPVISMESIFLEIMGPLH